MTAAGVLVAGEALVDIVTDAGGNTNEHVGGSPANVAVTLARLGNDVTLLAATGDDARGRRVRDHLHDNGVKLLPEGPVIERTPTAAATLAADGQATYEFDLINRYDEAAAASLELAGFECLHTGSIGATLAPGSEQIARIVQDARLDVTISYDPNARPAIMGSAQQTRVTVERLVALSDIVKLSDDDARWLAPETTPRELAQAWQKLGPAFVVITEGSEGAYGVSRAGTVQVPGATVSLVDTVGAGDSFSGALIDALLRKRLLGADRREALRDITIEDLRDVMGFAVSVAAVTVSRPGADPPRREEISSH